ncbi:MAG TPA: DUF979 family protein [Xanthomonadaceae bacterium]|jgi:uncharacterized membrane protein|nr:DUF979 family protein [Xanthomonadaceae bacterium]
MLRIEYAYWFLAAFFFAAAWMNLHEHRWAATAFWAVLAVLLAGGDFAIAARQAGDTRPMQLAGLCVVALAILAPMIQRPALPERQLDERLASALRLRHRLFAPALLIPAVTVVFALLDLASKKYQLPIDWLIGNGSATLVGLAAACIVALLAALLVTRSRPALAISEGRRLLDSLGWAALLPLVLAALGAVFTATGVGNAVAALVANLVPTQHAFACVLAYGFGMVAFTVIMGNAFAAFPVITAGIGLPLLIRLHGADAAVVGSLGMLTGYCGTLLTPMAANFNIVPAVLLELDDRNGVIRAQWPTALLLLVVNLTLMMWLAFR